jgi:RNA polymerase primary sigma factor
VRTLDKTSNEELIQLIKDNIDIQDNYEQLYKQNHGFIYLVVRKRVHGIYEIDDLMQQAYIALVKAVELYDSTKEETNFLTLLKFCIHNSIRDLDGGLPEHMKQSILKYKKIRKEIYESLGNEPSDNEMMLYMNITYKKLVKIKQFLYENISLDDQLTNDGAATRKDFIADETAHLIAQDELEQDDIKIQIHQALNGLPDNIKNVITDVYMDSKTLTDVGKKLGVSTERVRQIENNGMRLLRNNKKFIMSVADYITDDVDAYSRKPVIEIIIEREDLERKKRKVESEYDRWLRNRSSGYE